MNVRLYKLNLLVLISLLTVIVMFIFKTSISCNYRINVKTDIATWEGICQLGVSRWTISSNDGKSVWKVSALSFYHNKSLYYIVTNRVNVINHYNSNEVDKFQLLDQTLFQYSVYKINKNNSLLFSTFPNDRIYVAEIFGELSYSY